MVPKFWKLLPYQSIGYNSAYSLKHLNKAVNIEDFIQPASGKPDPDLVLEETYSKLPSEYSPP